MKNTTWFSDLHTTDTLHPTENVDGEIRYTLYQKDFLQMPTVEFIDLSELDPDLRALLN